MSDKLLNISKSRVDRAGETLKMHDSPSGEDQKHALSDLASWRAIHALPLNSFAAVLRKNAKAISKSNKWIVAQRLKRTHSIVLKLKTHKTMRLSTMQDIGGVRAILGTIQEVYELVDFYRKKRVVHKLFSLDDYTAYPKADGYRSVHLVYQLNKDPKIFIEIQIRSHLQHIWATAVEVFGTLRNSSFKSGYGDKAWLDLFAYLSSLFAIKEGTAVLKEHTDLSHSEILIKLKNMIEDLKVIEQLSLYTSIYKITAAESGEKKNSGHYTIILLDSHKSTISIRSFAANQLDEAMSVYAELEKKFYDDLGVNVVLVNAGDIKKLEESYPNYFMDTRELIRYLSQIRLDKF